MAPEGMGPAMSVPPGVDFDIVHRDAVELPGNAESRNP